MLVIKNFNKIKESAKSILPPDLHMYVCFKNEFNYEMSFIYNRNYAKDIYVILERERYQIGETYYRPWSNHYKLIVKGHTHTLWNNGIPTKTTIQPLVIQKVISDTTLKNATHFLEGITEIILSNFDDPGYKIL